MTREDAQQPEGRDVAREWYAQVPYVPVYRVPGVELSEPAAWLLGAIVYGMRRRLARWEVEGDIAMRVTIGSLAAMADVGRRSVTRAIPQLIDAGLIAATERSDRQGWSIRLLAPPAGSRPPGATVAPRRPDGRAPQARQSRPAGATAPCSDRARVRETERELKRSGQRGTDHVQISEVEGLAAELYRRLGHAGDDGAIVWRVAALVVAGRIARAVAVDATEAVRHGRPRNVIGYYRRAVGEHCARAGVPLDELLAGLRPPEGLTARARDLGLPIDDYGWPTRSPVQRPTQLSLELTSRLPRAPAGSGQEDERRRQLAALAQAEHRERHARDPPAL